MWVKLLTVKNIERQGKMRTYSPGDWVDVGKHLALRWVNAGDAELPTQNVAEFIDVDSCGIVLTDHEDTGKAALVDLIGRVGVTVSTAGDMRWPKTLFWNPELPIRVELLPVAFHLLETWQVLVPLLSYETLACDVGQKNDKERTLATVHDLRVPLYDWRMVFVRRCSDTRYLMNCWDEERIDSTDPFHSLLRAVYRAKPLLLTLPITWSDRGAEKGEE